jgi:hypothetical protein
MKTKYFLCLIAIVLLTACASSAEAQPPVISGAWARPGAAGQTSAIYMTIENPNASADELLGAATNAAKMTELHKTVTDENGVSTMQRQPQVDLPSRSKVVFEPGGLHIMLMNLQHELKPGDVISVILNFKNAGEIMLEIPVRE